MFFSFSRFGHYYTGGKPPVWKAKLPRISVKEQELSKETITSFSESDLKSGTKYSFSLPSGKKIHFGYNSDERNYRISFEQGISFNEACDAINLAFKEKYPNNGIAIWKQDFDSLKLTPGYYSFNFDGKMSDYPDSASFVLLSGLIRLSHSDMSYSLNPSNPFKGKEFIIDSGAILVITGVLGITRKTAISV